MERMEQEESLAKRLSHEKAAFSWKGERRTWALLVTVYTAWLFLTYYFSELPYWLSLPLGALLVAWHSSIQHEVIHGHPSQKQWLNDLLGFPPLGIVYPYHIYKWSHLEHHDTDHLTDPHHDHESYYLTADQWQRFSRPQQVLFRIHNTLLGRLVIGPAITVVQFYWNEARRILEGNRDHLYAWLLHIPAVLLVFVWLTAVCSIPVWLYVCGCVYPGLAIILLRSYAEHRPHEEGNERRSIIVEAETPLRILFLGNNYHYLHHKAPWVPWYQLEDIYQDHKDEIVDANGGYFYKGYRSILYKYGVVEKDFPVHPQYPWGE